MSPRLDNWHCDVYPADGFTAPEMQDRVLIGRVTGHPRYRDGETIRTGALVGAKGRMATTASGTVYELGEVDSRYLAWLQENGISFDPENPIRIVKEYGNVARGVLSEES